MFKVLYVDDEPVLLEIAKIFLEKTQEFSIDVSTSAYDVLRSEKIKSYDAIISDYQMPGMDGISFLKHIHTEFGDIPFIIFTGKGREDVVIAALNNGADYYVNKGIDPRSRFDEISHKIKKAVKRRQDREAIKNSERRLSDIVNFLPDATFAIDREGNVIAWNKAMEELTGVQKTTIIGEGDHIYALPFYGKRRPLLLDLILKENKETEENYPFIHNLNNKLISEMYFPILHGGKGAFLWFIASPLYDANGNISGAIESIRDITENKRAEHALKESEEQYRSLFESTRDAIFLIENMRFVSCNNRAMEIFGCTKEQEIIGRTLIDFSPVMQPDRVSSEQKGQEKIFSALDHTPQYFEWLFTHLDGTPFYAEVSLNHLSLDGKTLLQAIVRDVSERKKAEDALMESERTYRNVVEDQAELISRFRPDGTHIFVNKAYCRYFNKTYDDIIGKKFFPRIPQEDHRHVREHFASLNKENPSAIDTHRVIMPDGSIRWQRWSDRAIFNKKGSVIEYQSVGRDITENKRMEDALALACQKMNLLSSITRHDILNQLTVLSGYLTLSEEFTSDEKLLSFIKKETAATERINQQITFTKEYQDIGVHAPQWQNIHDTIVSAANLLDMSLVDLQVNLNDIKIYADPLSGKVFYNLLENAIGHGEKTSMIRFSARENGDKLTIICEDNGVGIDAETKKHLFVRGYGKNNGYGLFLIREILAITGISIIENGEPGKGARFEITVPNGAYQFISAQKDRYPKITEITG
ncbi:MAG: PAS domain S-box protein [Methanoregula sp.]|jgi:PAS domain S-box-containing protein|nr:PAS domain S-box protein [Methanoregula sp.]